jgi:hypothetical protein
MWTFLTTSSLAPGRAYVAYDYDGPYGVFRPEDKRLNADSLVQNIIDAANDGHKTVGLILLEETTAPADPGTLQYLDLESKALPPKVAEVMREVELRLPRTHFYIVENFANAGDRWVACTYERQSLAA